MIYKLRLKRWFDDTVSIVSKEKTAYSLKEAADPMEFLKVTSDSKVWVKDYDQFTSSQVRMINDFNNLDQFEREILLRKGNK